MSHRFSAAKEQSSNWQKLVAILKKALEQLLTHAVKKPLPPNQQARPARRRLLRHLIEYARKLASQKQRPQ